MSPAARINKENGKVHKKYRNSVFNKEILFHLCFKWLFKGKLQLKKWHPEITSCSTGTHTHTNNVK